MNRAFLATLVLLLLPLSPVHAQEINPLELEFNASTGKSPEVAPEAVIHRKRKKKKATGKVSDTGIPLLPNGEPDYSKFPNPFVVKRWGFDLGGTTGDSVSHAPGTGYTEFGLGVSAYFYDFLDWHNFFFYRSAQDGTNLFGLDTSERFVWFFSKQSGFGLFGAPGFRFATVLGTVPFLEAGVHYAVGGFKLSAGAREMFGSAVVTGVWNEVQYFVQLEGRLTN